HVATTWLTPVRWDQLLPCCNGYPMIVCHVAATDMSDVHVRGSGSEPMIGVEGQYEEAISRVLEGRVSKADWFSSPL
ncbi:hypothetical protein Tco_0619774, partial [Tanacetum coccineum]